jgi:Ribbon-helix-helix protein, copG family
VPGRDHHTATPHCTTYGAVTYMKRTTVYLPDGLKRRVEWMARERKLSEAEVIRTAIDQFTRGVPGPAPRLPLFASLGAPDLAERAEELLDAGFGRE